MTTFVPIFIGSSTSSGPVPGIVAVFYAAMFLFCAFMVFDVIRTYPYERSFVGIVLFLLMGVCGLACAAFSIYTIVQLYDVFSVCGFWDGLFNCVVK